ncbi:sugar phosphate isomerase/epimerase [Desulfosarcina sp. OttesenSCG-928-A07]|nr:sugar phosphate isomerase/epimerase [Desulfosarcina sp. OttesenSCG-928-A07]
MRYGAMNFPAAPVTAELEAIASQGFDYLELAMDPPMAHYPQLMDQRKAIMAALNANGLGLVCHLPTFVSTADLTESIRLASIMEMRRSLETAALLGAEKVVIHPSMAVGMGNFVLDQVKELTLLFLAEMVAEANRLCLPLCLENMFPQNRLGVTPDDLAALLDPFPSLQMTLDTGHAHIGDKDGVQLGAMVKALGPRIHHIHVSDNNGERDAHLAVGQGTIGFDALVRDLKSIGYDDTITLEVFGDDPLMRVESRERLRALFER